MKIEVLAKLTALLVGLYASHSYAQDVDINLNPQKAFITNTTSGVLEVKICNCHTANVTVPSNKLRPLISLSDNLVVESVTNSDGSILTDFSVQTLSNDPGNHGVRLLMNTTLSNASCTSFSINVQGDGVGIGRITASLGFKGSQTIGNVTANDNALAAIPVQVNLPVVLKEFRVKKESRTAILDWATTEEIDASHFDVQRSSDGRNWQTFTSVKAKGDSRAQINYSATDTEPFNGENFYRLHMIDTDDSSTYSLIRTLRFELESVYVFPNPVGDILHIKADDWNKIRHIRIRNTNGEQIYHSLNRKVAQINLAQFNAGMYIVEIIMNNGEVKKSILAVVK